MATLRTKVRQSVLALLVSYLRDGTTDTAKFTTLEGVAGTYPSTQRAWTFTVGGELYPIAELEAFRKELPYGVTLRFDGDTAEPSKAMPQAYSLVARIDILVPIALVGESVAQQIAQKVDEALWRSTGKLEIKDYDVNPPIGTSNFVQWQAVPRGNWSFQDTKGRFESLRLDLEMRYSVPKSEW